MSKPVGVFGGIFDPVHYGHLSAALLAYDFFHLEKIIYVPAGVPPHKESTVTASPSDRLTMLHIALSGESHASIWEQEVNKIGISYTIDTLQELRLVYPDSPLYFIVGADNLTEIHTWQRYREILAMVTLCVTDRPGFSMKIPPTLAGANIQTFPSPHWGVSSSLLRTYITKEYTCKHLVPEKVREYIFKNNLYQQCKHVCISKQTNCS